MTQFQTGEQISGLLGLGEEDKRQEAVGMVIKGQQRNPVISEGPVPWLFW